MMNEELRKQMKEQEDAQKHFALFYLKRAWAACGYDYSFRLVDDGKTVEVLDSTGFVRCTVNVGCDSPCAMMYDIFKHGYRKMV